PRTTTIAVRIRRMPVGRTGGHRGFHRHEIFCTMARICGPVARLSACLPAGMPQKRNRPAIRSGWRGDEVEVPGIEPGSSVALPGLLRAQLAMPLLGPTDHASESV